MLTPNATSTSLLHRLSCAAEKAQQRGLPEDLALLQMMAQDLNVRVQARQLPADAFVGLPCPRAPKPCGAAQKDAPVYELQHSIARADWRGHAGDKRLADALIDVAYGRSPQAAARRHNVAPAELLQCQIALHTQGLQALMALLGCPS